MLSAQNSFSRENGAQDTRASHTPMLPSRKQGVEYWKSFPLSDVESIQKWQQDCHRTQSRLSPSQDGGDAIKLSKAANLASTRSPTDAHSVSEENQTNIQSPGDGPSTITPKNIQGQTAYLSRHIVNRESENSLLQSEIDYHDRGFRESDPRPPLSSKEQDGPSISKEFSLWEAAPSVQFQRQFLW
jgi:hypothetical protein